MKKYMSKLLAITLAIIFILTGCQSQAPSASNTPAVSPAASQAAAPAASQAAAPAASQAATPAAPAPTKREDLVVVMFEELISFDPHSNTMTSDGIVLADLYTTLYKTDGNGQPVFDFATFIDQDDTGAIVKFKDYGKFEDGTPITVDDVVFSLNRARQSTAMASNWTAVTNISAVDATTIRIDTNGPMPSLTQAMSGKSAAILSKEHTEKIDAGQGDWSQPFSSGRYKLKERSIGDYVTYVKNEHHWSTIDGDGAVMHNSLTYKVVPEASSRNIMVETGEADLNMNFMTSDYDRVKDIPTLELHENMSTAVEYFGFDVTLPPFDNKLVRQAMQYAIDREAVNLIAMDGFGNPHFTIIPPSTLGYLEKPIDYYYSPEKAKEILAEAGYPNGFEIEITTINDLQDRVASVVQMCLADIGIKAEIKRIETAVRFELAATHQQGPFVARYGMTSEPDRSLPNVFAKAGIGGPNQTHYWSQEVEDLLAQGRGMFEPDPRIPIYQEIQTKIMDDSPWIPLVVGKVFVLTRSGLQGVTVYGQSAINLYNMHY